MKQRYLKIVALAAPLVGAMVSQNLLNLVDSWMIGRIGDAHMGKVALAATAAGGILTWLISTPVMSLSTGVQQISARRFGQERISECAHSLNAGMVLALLMGLPLALVLRTWATEILGLIKTDREVLEYGVPYLKLLALGIPLQGLNFCFRGYWNGINRQKVYMQTLFAIHATNVFLNWVFIFGNLGAPAMGTKGAALGSVLAIAVGTIIYFILGATRLRHAGFLRPFPFRKVMKEMVRLSIPNAMQQFLYSASYNVLYKVIAMLGTAQLAAAGVIMHLALVCYLPGIAFGLVATSLVGQALGRKDIPDAKLWTRQITIVSMSTLFVVSLPMIIVPEFLLSIFIREQATVALGITALRILGCSLFLEAAAMVHQHALLGAGDSKRVLLVSITAQWGVYIPLGYLLALTLGLGLAGVWLSNLVVQAILTAAFVALWRQGRWKEIEV